MSREQELADVQERWGKLMEALRAGVVKEGREALQREVNTLTYQLARLVRSRIFRREQQPAAPAAPARPAAPPARPTFPPAAAAPRALPIDEADDDDES